MCASPARRKAGTLTICWFVARLASGRPSDDRHPFTRLCAPRSSAPLRDCRRSRVRGCELRGGFKSMPGFERERQMSRPAPAVSSGAVLRVPLRRPEKRCSRWWAGTGWPSFC